MLANVLSLLLLLGLAVLCGWLLTRAWHVRRAVVRWPLSLLAGLLTVLLLLIAGVAALGMVKMYAPQPNKVASITVGADPQMISRGQRLAGMCVECHSSTGQQPLDGSKANMLDGGPPAGTFYAPNLTPGGPLKDWSDGEIVRAIREGVHKDGRALLIMPSMAFHGMSDADAQALVAYLRSQPVVQRDVPPMAPNILAALFVGSGMFPTSAQTPITGPIVAPQRAVSAEYGGYLVNGIGGCRDCHGQDLGGHVNSGPTDAPTAPNLRGTAGAWSTEDFVKTIRTGINPQGHQLSPDMPVKDVSAAFEDDELAAIHAYIKSLGVSRS